ncbi:MAG: response regulator [Campylobacterales bacterium]|nr:response regulator [Campylobacterales bacterium]
MSHKILVVDDSHTIRKIIKTNLDRLGIQGVLEASDGDAAVGAVAMNPDISIILMDYNMPNMNGLTALKKIRENKACRAKVIVISSVFTQAITDSFRGLGVSGFLTKPFDLQKFNDILVPIMSGSAPAIEKPKVKGIPKEEVIRLFRDENPTIRLDGLFVEFEFTREKIKLDVDSIARNGSIYTELASS